MYQQNICETKAWIIKHKDDQSHERRGNVCAFLYEYDLQNQIFMAGGFTDRQRLRSVHQLGCKVGVQAIEI
jgi:hypothetical protein